MGLEVGPSEMAPANGATMEESSASGNQGEEDGATEPMEEDP